MKKTNVSSEVLILLKNLEKCAPRRTPFWAPKRTPKRVQEQPKTGSLFGHIFGPILGSLLEDFGCHLGPKTGPGEVWRSLREPSGAPRGQKTTFKKWFSHRTVCIFSLLRPPKDGPKRPRRLPKRVPRELRSLKKQPPTRA